MRIHGVHLFCLDKEALYLPQSSPRAGAHDRRDQHPIRPGLRDERIGLEIVQHLLPLLADSLDLVRRCRGRQGLVGRLQLLVELVHLALERDELAPGILVLAERGNRLHDFVRIHLRGQVHANHHRVSLEAGVDLLIEDQDQARRVRPDLV